MPRRDKDGAFGLRLIVSRSPLTWMRANELCLGRRLDSDWVGTVAVYKSWHEELDQVVPWGKLFLYGDRSLIMELTGRTDFDPLANPEDLLLPETGVTTWDRF